MVIAYWQWLIFLLAAFTTLSCFGTRINSVENRVSIHDLHATVLHALGLDHTQLTYRYAGRDFRLTDVFGDVVKDILI